MTLNVMSALQNLLKSHIVELWCLFAVIWISLNMDSIYSHDNRYEGLLKISDWKGVVEDETVAVNN